jgi:Flp pilus assembly protein TadB
MPTTESSGRGTFLTILLMSLFTAGVFVFCLGVMGEAFLAALAIVAVIGCVGLSHYFLWGRSMEREVRLEREVAMAEDEDMPPETNGWPSDGPHGTRRF